MPRKNDLNGPISMRLTCTRDLKTEQLPIETVRDMLKEINKTDKIFQVGRHLYSTSNSNDVAPDGTKWSYKQFTIYADDFMITCTIQTIQGRESESQCKELHEAVLGILGSIKRESLHVEHVDENDKEMNSAIAKAKTEVDKFIKIIQTDSSITSYSVKVPIKDGEEEEHFWLSDVKFSDGKFTGKIDNDPETVKNVKMGQNMTVSKTDISDWLYMKNRDMYGNYTLRVLIKRMPKDELESMQKQFTLK